MHSSNRPVARRSSPGDSDGQRGGGGGHSWRSPRSRRSLLVALLLVAATAGAVADELWERALDVVEANQDWFASRIEIEMQQLNSSGRVVEEGTTRVTRSISNSGRIQESVTRTGSFAPDHESLLSGGLGLPAALRTGEGALGLFVRSRQDEIVLSRQRRTERLPGNTEAAVYRYTQPAGDGSMTRGRVWVDVNTAVPVRMEAIPDEAPDPLVSSTTLLYFEPSPVNWYPVRLEMTGTARRVVIVVIERRIQTTVRISGYTRYRD